MSFQKTGLRIMQLISIKKNKEDQGSSEIQETCLERDHQRPHSWTSQRTKFADEACLIPVLAPRMEPPLAPSLKAAHSSASSLCSCDCDSNNVSMAHSLSIAISPQSTPNAASIRKDTRSWNLSFSDILSEPASLSISNAQIAEADSALNLFEALSMDPSDGHKIPTQVPLNMKSIPSKQWSDNVEQLIRETDEAFKGVDFATTDVKEAIRDWSLKDHNTSMTRDTAKYIARKQIKVPTTRHASVSKPKRKKSSKVKAKSSKNRKLALQTHGPFITHSPRWTLTEVTGNMAELFGGRIFGRLEADEMLKPDGHSRYADGNPQDSNAKQSFETASGGPTDEVPSSAEPSYLDDLPSRLGNTRIISDNTEESISPRPPPPPPIPNDNDRHRIERVNMDTSVKINLLPSSSRAPPPDQNDLLQFGNLKFPAPPQRSPRSRSATRATNLATIPEVSPVIPNKESPLSSAISSGTVSQNSVASPGSERMVTTALLNTAIQRGFQSKSQKQSEAENAQLLKSTPYSMTSPLFKHGAIRLNKADKTEKSSFIYSGSGDPMRVGTLRRNLEDEQPGALDWTAFQMAISGGAGDFLMGGEDVESSFKMMQDMEDEINDILEWWDSFGFSDKNKECGKIVQEETKQWLEKKDLTTYKTENIAELPTAMNIGKAKELEVSTPRSPRTKEAKPRPESGYESDYSLPDSPMDEIKPEQTDNEGSPVLMGFNLGHDLLDFLKWEAEHVEGLMSTQDLKGET